MEKKRYLINEVAQKLGISAAAIRLYEKKGLFSSKRTRKTATDILKRMISIKYGARPIIGATVWASMKLTR